VSSPRNEETIAMIRTVGVRTVRVLSDVEFTKDDDRFVPQVPTVG